MQPSVSVVISAYNEAKKIGMVLDAVAWADERIVVDNSSTDDTAKIARAHGAKVYRQPNRLMLNTNKNFGFSKAKGDWILNLDGDEEVTPELAAEIKATIAGNPTENGFWLSRKNIIFGKWIRHGLWWPDRQLRLFRREKGKFPCVHIHEYIEVEGMAANLTEPYIHHNYETIAQYLTKIDRCTKSESQSLVETNYTVAWYDAIRFPLSDFIKIYFAQGGYKDGLHGLVLAMLQACYSFLTFARVWEAQGFPDRDLNYPYVAGEFAKSGRELRHWLETERLESERNPVVRLWHRLRWKISDLVS